ncbi:MAG TPA: amino acid ABC transporter permease [Marmoricola sp.]|jgi:polar amino acid transport system permease protein|nr:amino acid ABC transporter permease [Marmoricola sp.]
MIDAVPVRHPGRWVAVAVLAVLAAMLIDLLVTNKAFDWDFVRQALVQTPVIRGLLVGTLLGTVLAMLLGVSLGVVLAVMRLSDNPVLAGAAWVYTWFFRAIPRLVLLTIMGTLGILWPDGLGLGVPFVHQIAHALGGSADATFATVNANKLFSGLFAGVLGLGLSEAAYMAEIARAGILSVDPGQREAANALGMGNGLAMRRIVLPQAMRVIVPPTGNETIAMLKDTSLLIAVPLGTEMFFQLEAIGSRTFKTFPVYIAAVIWYLVINSVLMAVQARLERHFGRGFGTKPTPTDQANRTTMLGLAAGGAR